MTKAVPERDTPQSASPSLTKRFIAEITGTFLLTIAALLSPLISPSQLLAQPCW